MSEERDKTVQKSGRGKIKNTCPETRTGSGGVPLVGGSTS